MVFATTRRALSYRIGEVNIAQLLRMTASDAKTFLGGASLGEREREIAGEPLRQIHDRIGFLESVGLGYLGFDRPLRTLSGGETQRVALTSALGGSLVNMLYVLDEPTAGLHACDVERLTQSIHGLRDRGNTVIVVEHNETMIESADSIIEVGPGAGVEGGEITFQGTPNQLKKDRESLTGQFLCGQRGSTLRQHEAREPRGRISLRGASGNNLKSLDVDFPLGGLCVVTGISGSGKSSLVQDTLFEAIKREKLGQAASEPLRIPIPFRPRTGPGLLAWSTKLQSVGRRGAARSPTSKHSIPSAKSLPKARKPEREDSPPGHFTFNGSKGTMPRMRRCRRA